MPNAASAKAFDRYAYVENNPVRYSDPSGHFLNVAIGAGIGFLGDYAFQTYRNMQDRNMNFPDAVSWSNINKSELIGSTVVGTVAGATFGAGLALGGVVFGAETLGASVVGGAFSGAVAGQVGSLVEGMAREAVQEDGDNTPFDMSEGFQAASQLGLGNPGKIASDAVVNGITAGVGKITGDVLDSFAANSMNVELRPKIIPVIDMYRPLGGQTTLRPLNEYYALQTAGELNNFAIWQSISSTLIQPIVEDPINRCVTYIKDNLPK